MPAAYPGRPGERDRWILDQRGARNAVDANVPYLFFVEHERAASGEVVPVAALFLTNRECPWRCAMCDLWRNTLPVSVELGAIPRQIAYALERIGPARHIKLYNSGSFFDPRAIPPDDYAEIAALLADFEHVIVESHPALLGERTLRFQSLLRGTLEVAVGLETAHPQALDKLNKRMTPEDFGAAGQFLHDAGIAMRAFVLVQPPFVPLAEAPAWAKRSLDFAFDQGASAVSIILTRRGEGAMKSLEDAGLFVPPSLRALEELHAYGVRLQRGRVFADVWGVEKASTCRACLAERKSRLQAMNASQAVAIAVSCPACGGTS